MSSHHKMGMSKWTPWNTCSHFDSIDDSRDAKIGSDKHDKLCRLLNGDDTVDIDESDILDRAVRWAAGEIKLTCGDEVLYTEETVEIKPEISNSLAGIYGTVDAFFVQHVGDEMVVHVFDFKSMSHGSKDVWPQLKGYALGVVSMLGCFDVMTKCVLHVLHGGVFKHDIIETDVGECIAEGERIVNLRKFNDAAPHCPSSWCKYCKHSSSCEATQKQVDIVKSGALMQFSAPKRLVIIEELESILKKAKEEAKAEIALAPNRTIEDDGVAYAIVSKNGPSSLADGQVIPLYNACTSYGVTAEDFLGVCKMSKTDVMKLLQAKGMKLKSKDPAAITAESVVSPYFASKTVDKLERVK